MKFGLKHLALGAAILMGSLSLTSNNAQAQALPADIVNQLNAAIQPGATANILNGIRALMDANPELAGAIAAAAGGRVPTLAAAIGGQAAAALAGSNLTPEAQAAQMQAAAQGLATANPAAALAIFQTVAAAAPSLSAAAGAGARSAPGVNQADVAIIEAQTVIPAGGPTTPPPLPFVPPPPPVTPPELIGPVIEPEPDPPETS